jgi:DNA polymerase
MTEESQIVSASNLDDLNKIISGCQKCDLYKSKIKDVPGAGNPKAKIFFIGEAPGKKEDELGEPFVGSAGQFLNEMLSGISLNRSDVFIGNVLKHRPPANRDPLPEEIKACWPYLNRQIELIDPQLIIFLGRHALNRFFPDFKISEVHGQAFRRQFGDRKRVFLALFHPAAALYNGGLRETLIKDFNKIPKILNKIQIEKDQNTG